MFTDSYFLIMVFVDITEDNISELMKSKDSKSTQRAVTQSIKLFRDFLIQKMNLENLKLTQIKNWMRC
jgi:flagellar biosynthesis protein FliP